MRARGLRVLIVEENAGAAEMLSYLLAAEGHHCSIAADEDAALRAIAESQPEVALIGVGGSVPKPLARARSRSTSTCCWRCRRRSRISFAASPPDGP